jgi:hypothetical protein
MPDNVHIGGTSDKTAPAIMCGASIRRPPASGLAILRCWYRYRQLLLIHESSSCDIYHNLRNFWVLPAPSNHLFGPAQRALRDPQAVRPCAGMAATISPAVIGSYVSVAELPLAERVTSVGFIGRLVVLCCAG